ncbi:phosphosugar binding protein [Salmonella enterica subsp. enterica]|uniref:Phosphosugar binding protein n=1 Tax=Salmonella enterica I TaxID=59201 RepID=A0A447TWX4_SALET|nr:phosphosugar binding protein [Salmonella enterica subsp. enterica]
MPCWNLAVPGWGWWRFCDEQHVVKGVFTDGDLRRWLVGGGALTTPVSEAMTPNGITLQAQKPRH